MKEDGVIQLEPELDVDEVLEPYMEADVTFKADTIEELADKLGFEGEDKTAFLAQVERYNELYDTQDDSDFGKEAYRLSELRTPPFYGSWFGGSLLTTLDGIKINEDTQAIDDETNVIEGLYAAGDCSGSFFSGNYPEILVGIAAGRSAVEARHAVLHAAGRI